MFLPETVKQRQARKSKDVFNWSDGDGGNVVFRADNHINKLHITKDEWGAANQRVCHYLMEKGELARKDVESYMSYTIMIHDFASIYEWHSVLDYDHRYRELQAESGMTWGESAAHL